MQSAQAFLGRKPGVASWVESGEEYGVEPEVEKEYAK
jgi:hypothetical protein